MSEIFQRVHRDWSLAFLGLFVVGTTLAVLVRPRHIGRRPHVDAHVGVALGNDVFRRALAVVGPDRLLFGTDSSFFPRGWVANVYEQQSSALDEIGAGTDVREKIFSGNFERVFPASD